jgi:uncharacterized damage-inducible protein DinB
VNKITAHERPATLPVGSEQEQLDSFLDHYRASLLMKVADLSIEQLKSRPIPSTTLTLLGLLRHMTGVEEWWFQEQLTGVAPEYTFDATDDPDTDFNDLDSHDLAAVATAYERAVEVARANTLDCDLDGLVAGTTRAGGPINLRWIYVHMIEEYARHVGHADLLREAIDGSTGV